MRFCIYMQFCIYSLVQNAADATANRSAEQKLLQSGTLAPLGARTDPSSSVSYRCLDYSLNFVVSPHLDAGSFVWGLAAFKYGMRADAVVAGSQPGQACRSPRGPLNLHDPDQGLVLRASGRQSAAPEKP